MMLSLYPKVRLWFRLLATLKLINQLFDHFKGLVCPACTLYRSKCCLERSQCHTGLNVS